MPLHVELITPERHVLSDDVDSIVAPSEGGELGILPRHAPLLAKLVAGDLRLKKEGQVRHVAITGGFLEVQANSHVRVFAETAEWAEDIDVERARMAAEKAKMKLSKANDLTALELAEVENALGRALVRMKVAQGTQWRKLPPERRS